MRRWSFCVALLLAGCAGDDPSPGFDGGGRFDEGGRSDADSSSERPDDVSVPPEAGTSSVDAMKDADAAAQDASDEAAAPYDPCPPQGTPCKIMPLGDSITDGVGGTVGGSYRVPLFHLALSHQQAITFVGSGMNGPNTVDTVPFPKGHEGHSGYTIDDIGDRQGIHDLTVPAMDKYHPHVITLMIGTNDVANSFDLANAPKRLAGLLDDILAADSTVLLVVAKIVPTRDDNTNIRVKAYNDAIPALVKTRADAGKHVIMVDMFAAFQANASYKTDYMSDDLHPKDAGYAKMADVWYDAIGPLFR